MANEAIDVAYVEIQPDFKDFEKTVDHDVKSSLDDLMPVIRELVDEMEHQFKELAQVIREQFDELRFDLTNDLSRIGDATERTATEVSEQFREGTNAAGRQFDQLARGAERDLDKIETKAKATGDGLSRGFSGMLLGGALVGGVFAAGAGLEQLTSFGLQSAASLEQTQIQFKALTGSAQKGQEVLTQLQKFAALTPFEFPDVAHAAARFLTFDDAVGISDDQLQNFLTTTGNVISVTGGGAQALNTVTLAMGQIASTGKLTLDNLNQISEALPGFSGVAAIASARGETTAQVMSEISHGEISAKDGINALLQGMQKFPGAAGAMEAQGQTLLGVFSTFKDTIGQALAQAFNPVIPAIKDALTNITPILGDALTQVAPAIGKVLAALLPLAGQLVQALVPILTPLINGLTPALAGIGDALGPLGAALGQIVTAAAPLLPVLGQLIGSLASGLAPIIGSLEPAIQGFVMAISSIATSLGPVLEQIGPQIGAIILPLADQLSVAFTTLGPAIEGLLPILAQIAGIYLQALAQVLPQILQAFLPMAPSVTQLAEAMAQVLIALMPLIQLFADFAVFMAPFIADIITVAAKLANWGIINTVVKNLNLLAQAITWVMSNGDTIIGWFEALPGEIWNAISAIPSIITSVIQQAFHDVFFVIGYGVGLIVGEFLAWPHQVAAAVTWFVTDLPKIIGNGLKSAYNAVVNFVGDVASFMRSLPGKVIDAAKDLWPQLKNSWGDLKTKAEDIGKDIIQGIINGIKNGASNLASAAKDAAKSALDGAKKALGINSPSKEFAKVGDGVMEGFQLGIERSTPGASNLTADSMNAILGRVSGGGTTTNSSSSTSQVTIGAGAIVVHVDGASANGQQIGQQAGQALLSVLQSAGLVTYNQPRTV